MRSIQRPNQYLSNVSAYGTDLGNEAVDKSNSFYGSILELSHLRAFFLNA